jgi:hypothetical protein
MSGRRRPIERQMRGSGVASERSLWRGIACVAAWSLIGWVALIGPASAGIVKEATDRVAPTAASAYETVDALPPAAKAVPPPPQVVPPPPKVVPPPPKVVPPPPKVVPPPPAAPRLPSRPTGQTPSNVPSTPSQRQPSSGEGHPSDKGIVRAAGDAGGSVTSVAREASDRVSTAPSEGGSANPAPGNYPEGAGEKTRLSAAGTAKRTPLSVGPADVATVRRWFARVWPAIALGGEGGQGLLLPAIAELLRPVIALADRSLLAVAGVVRAVGDDGSSRAGNPVQPNAPNGFLSNVAAAADWKRIPYLVAIAALLALLAFTMWREFRSALHPHVR